jgi:N-sulfoglucosamine sulfohydrolase
MAFLRPLIAALLLSGVWGVAVSATPSLNILLITADDLNYDTPGFAGGKMPGITPHLDQLAAQGIRFTKAHVAVAVCQPSRQCLMTGRYPHRNGSTGFYPITAGVPTLIEVLKTAGYHSGILGKVTHLQPRTKFPWDFQQDRDTLGEGRDPALFHRYTTEFLRQAKAAGRPFILMANSHDPHRPWAGSPQEKAHAQQVAAGKPVGGDLGGASFPAPARTYQASDAAVPGFLPVLPAVRQEMAEYYASVHRGDESVGEILRALKESGLEESTLVLFLSDNGISMPFAKSNCYLASTRTPLVIRWPGKTRPGRVESTSFVSSIDLMPTILDAIGVPPPPDMDGRSFLPLLLDATKTARSAVFTCYNDTSAKKPFPMRCLQTKDYGYIFNAWSDGQRTYRSEGMNGQSFPAMREASTTDQEIAARIQVLTRRTSEELYDIANDPDALHNLANDPQHHATLLQMRGEMLAWMKQTSDPLAPTYEAKVARAAQP